MRFKILGGKSTSVTYTYYDPTNIEFLACLWLDKEKNTTLLLEWCFSTRHASLGFSCYCETMNEMAYLFIFHITMDND